MAKIVISGLKVKGLSIAEADAEGNRKVSGSYGVVLDTGKVIATQSFNVYGGIDVVWSPRTLALIDQTLSAIKGDLDMVSGLGGSEDEE